MARVTIADATKNYGAVKALHGVSIDVRDGEFLTLVGPSGCGKSTLLRMIAGLEEISGGTVSIGDRVVNDLAPKERDIAMVFQNYALYPHMTVRQNMAFSMLLRKAAPETMDIEVGKAAEILGLQTLLDRYPKELSGGERQRVAMGRAIIRDPQVFLFDEPLSNLDAKLRVQMRSEIKSLHQRLGTTIIYVTHDQVEAMTMADRIVVMNGGRIEQIGAPLHLYDRPRNRFVAGFIGSPAMNFIDCQYSGGALQIIGSNLTIPVSSAMAEGPVVLGIRPEHVELAQNGLPARVEVVEPTGSETQVISSLGEQTLICLFKERLEIRHGTQINLAFPLEKLHFFDAKTGDAIDMEADHETLHDDSSD